MIRFSFLLVAASLIAIGLGWLAERDFAPLVVVRDGEQVLLNRVRSESAEMLEPGSVTLRTPLFSSARRVDGRLRVGESDVVVLQDEQIELRFAFWWVVSDSARFAASFPDTAQAEASLRAWIGENASAAAGAMLQSELSAASWGQVEIAVRESSDGAAEHVGIDLAALRIVELVSPRAIDVMEKARKTKLERLRNAAAHDPGEIAIDAKERVRKIELDAEAEVEALRGQIEADAARIYAEAHSQAPEFYAFVRGLEAYRKSIGPNTTLVLPPDSEFFRYLSPDGAR